MEKKSEESNYFNNVEILHSGEVKYSLQQPFSLMHCTTEKTSYYKIKVTIDALEKNIILFFNERFTVRDLFMILQNIEFGDKEKHAFQLLINNTVVLEDTQLSSYVKLTLLQTHNDDKDVVTAILKNEPIEKERRDHQEIQALSREPSDENIEIPFSISPLSPKIAKIPTSKRITKQEYIPTELSPRGRTTNHLLFTTEAQIQREREIQSRQEDVRRSNFDEEDEITIKKVQKQRASCSGENCSSDPQGDASYGSTPNLHMISSPQKRFLRKFYVLFPVAGGNGMTKLSRYVSVFLDLHSPVRSNLQKVLHVANSMITTNNTKAKCRCDKQLMISDYGIFCPDSLREVLVNEGEEFDESRELEEGETGMWLPNDKILMEALSPHLSQIFLEVRPYTTPKFASYYYCDLNEDTSIAPPSPSSSSSPLGVTSTSSPTLLARRSSSSLIGDMGIAKVSYKDSFMLESFLFHHGYQLESSILLFHSEITAKFAVRQLLDALSLLPTPSNNNNNNSNNNNINSNNNSGGNITSGVQSGSNSSSNLSTSSNSNLMISKYRLFNDSKSDYIEEEMNLYSYMKLHSISSLDLVNLIENPPLEIVYDYDQLHSPLSFNNLENNNNNAVNAIGTPFDSFSDMNIEKEIYDAIARMAEMGSKPDLIAGEILRKDFTNIVLIHPLTNTKIRGTIFITSFQMIFLTSDRSLSASKNSDVYLPLTSILKLTEIGRDGDLYGIQITCKDLRVLTFSLESNLKAGRMLVSYIARPPNYPKLFAFYNREIVISHVQQYNGWEVYSPMKEYDRLGLTSVNGWRVTNVNREFSICPSYPSSFIVPEAIDDDTLSKVAQFRVKGRIMATVWRNAINGATISRCSQPRVGFFLKSRSESDEKLVHLIRSSNLDAPYLYLLDSRPIANAKANQLRMGGHESTSIYTGCKLKFLSLANIHNVYDSFMKLIDICQQHYNQERWLSSLEESNWIQIVSSVLAAALRIVVIIDKKNCSIITHCSDGWDRTPQITSISQFLLDPYYRTLEGFSVLIEKEWCSFGHQFLSRCGHISTNTSDISPIFLIFIDCIFQILQQYPCSIEFNEKFLLFILDNLYSCRFGTFLYNNEKERIHHNLKERTISIWTVAFAKRDQFLNTFYRRNPQVLYPSYSIRKIQIWSAYYLRWISSPHPKEYPESIAKPAFQELLSLRKQLKIFQPEQQFKPL